MERIGSMSEQEIMNHMVSASLIATGSVPFSTGDNLATEKKTGEIPLGKTLLESQSKFALVIDKEANNDAGRLNIKVYNVDKVDGSNKRDCHLETVEVQMKDSLPTYQSTELTGLFVGSEKSIKLGMFFGADSSPSISPSASPSPSPSLSVSPSASASLSPSASISPSASTSLSPSASISPSASVSISPSASLSPSSSTSQSSSVSASVSPSAGLEIEVFYKLYRL